MRELKASTKKGQEIIEKASHYTGTRLHEVYDSWSQAKENAYNWCWEEYCNTEKSSGFGICSANTFGFTVSWCGVKDGEDILRYETKDNSYLVWLDR